eukprot:Phypoly_transcript_28159.p1 GENE.Phypoly_transcript_28159~~Phypoly_transcript_28159.p1  ORF type:complete len:109 (+),score=17.75 Phypoly_transcript_28159:40-327(+)
MDPQFSVLIKDTSAQGDLCKPKHKTNKKAIEIAVPVVVGTLLIIAGAVILYPRLSTWNKTRKLSRIASSDGVDMDIEKRGDMEAHTVSGNYSVKM